MDGLDVVGAPIVLLATNRPDSLDPAVVRDGRVDLKIRVGRPGMNEVEKIFRLNLKGKPIGLIGDDLPAFGALTLFADERPLAEVVCPKGERHRMFHHHAVNGAMVANICTRATQFAIRREINGGMVKGMLKADISSAISDSWKSMKDIDISNELQDFMDARAIQKAIDIRRVG
jgi:proteasome-associated ATPase